MKLSLRRPITDYGKVQVACGRLLRGRRFQLRRKQVLTKPYLNVGCGANFHAAFVNLDYDWRPGLDLCWDLRRGVPLPHGSLRGIFTEHCLEHVTFDDCKAALKEFRRLLQPGGTARIIVPDGELYMELYARAKAGEPVTFPYSPPGTPMMAVNRVFREYGHLFIYDAKTLGMLLQEAGFRSFERTEFLKGRDPTLLIDSPGRAVESLYVEGYA